MYPGLVTWAVVGVGLRSCSASGQARHSSLRHLGRVVEIVEHLMAVIGPKWKLRLRKRAWVVGRAGAKFVIGPGGQLRVGGRDRIVASVATLISAAAYRIRDVATPLA